MWSGNLRSEDRVDVGMTDLVDWFATNGCASAGEGI